MILWRRRKATSPLCYWAWRTRRRHWVCRPGLTWCRTVGLSPCWALGDATKPLCWMFVAVSCSWSAGWTSAARSSGTEEATGQPQCRWRSPQSQRSSSPWARGNHHHHPLLLLPHHCDGPEWNISWRSSPQWGRTPSFCRSPTPGPPLGRTWCWAVSLDSLRSVRGLLVQFR